MKIGILLSGSGVYDGTEIQEAVFTLLAVEQNGAQALFMAPNVDQMHVVNHLSGEGMNETRNVLIESARIARGDIEDILNISANDIEALILPGGFGTAKNHTTWAVKGPSGEINIEVKRLINEMIEANKPIVGLCMAPTTISKALAETEVNATLTVGSTEERSPYDIKAISEGMESIGSKIQMQGINGITIDKKNKIITAPCYMMEASALEVFNNIQQAVTQLMKWL